jgi:zinc transporter, ZIP family
VVGKPATLLDGSEALYLPGALVAALWGGLAAISLLIGAVIAVRLKPAPRVTGAIMGFGAGALIGSIAYDLLPESLINDSTVWVFAAFAAGALTFFAGDYLIDRRGGLNRKKISGKGSSPSQVTQVQLAGARMEPGGQLAATAKGSGSGVAIFLGTLLDGIPESLVLGIGLALSEKLSLAFLAAVFISNLPEGIAGTTSMIADGQSRRKVLLMWVGLVAASMVAAAVGYAFGIRVPAADGRVVQSFAAGAMLTMLADTMMPEAFEHGGKIVGLLTALGFLTAAIFAILE